MSPAIEYSFAADYDEYKQLLRRFTLDKLIMRINIESAKIMKAPVGEIGYGVITASYPMIDKKTLIKRSQDVLLTSWNLIDLAYNAILASNDFRGRKIENDEELYLLVSASDAIKEKRESDFLDTISDHDKSDFFLYLWGFAGEQLKIQSLAKAFKNAARELYILFESAKKVKDIPNVSDIVIKEVGVDWRTVISSLYLAWFGSTLNPRLFELEKSVRWDNSLKYEDFTKVIERYTSTYKDIRDSSLGRQYLYVRPFIKTQHNDVLSVNCFLNLFLYEHSILWIVRDYYQHKNDQVFTSKFGCCFEKYFEELLEDYLEPENFSKIPEVDTKRADWRIEIGDYRFLVEQKSTVLGLTAKQQEPDIATIKTFSERHIIKALRQLKNTERDFNNGKYIKMVLLYEDYLQTEVLDNIFLMETCDITDDHYYWLVTIEEMEMLLYLSKKDRNLFYNVVEEKTKRELEKSTNGRSLLKILNEKGVDSNQHLQQRKFREYEKIAFENVRQHLNNPH